MKHLSFLHFKFRTKSRKDDSKATQHSAETQLVDKKVTVKKAKVGRPRKKRDADSSSQRPYIYVSEKLFRFLQKEKGRRMMASGESMSYSEILESLLNL